MNCVNYSKYKITLQTCPLRWCAHLWGCPLGARGLSSRTPSLLWAPGWWLGGLRPYPYSKDVEIHYLQGGRPDGGEPVSQFPILLYRCNISIPKHSQGHGRRKGGEVLNCCPAGPGCPFWGGPGGAGWGSGGCRAARGRRHCRGAFGIVAVCSGPVPSCGCLGGGGMGGGLGGGAVVLGAVPCTRQVHVDVCSSS